MNNTSTSILSAAFILSRLPVTRLPLRVLLCVKLGLPSLSLSPSCGQVNSLAPGVIYDAIFRKRSLLPV